MNSEVFWVGPGKSQIADPWNHLIYKKIATIGDLFF